MYRAIVDKGVYYEGTFIVAVKTTGIFYNNYPVFLY